jgi:hypothetical protein
MCEIKSITLRKEEIWVSENRNLIKIFRPKIEEIRRNWKKKLHNEKLHNLNSSPRIIRMTKKEEYEKGRTCSTHANNEKCITNFDTNILNKDPWTTREPSSWGLYARTSFLREIKYGGSIPR